MYDDTFSFDSSGVEPSKPRELIRKGWYRAFITEATVEPTKAGDGKLLVLEHKILDGEYEGRKVWCRLNVKNPSAQAQEIAQRDLAAICHATGVLRFKHPAELRLKPMMVYVVVVPADGKFAEKNEVKGWKAVERPGVDNGGGATARQNPAGVAAGVEQDDDLPF